MRGWLVKRVASSLDVSEQQDRGHDKMSCMEVETQIWTKYLISRILQICHLLWEINTMFVYFLTNHLKCSNTMFIWKVSSYVYIVAATHLHWVTATLAYFFFSPSSLASEWQRVTERDRPPAKRALARAGKLWTPGQARCVLLLGAKTHMVCLKPRLLRGVSYSKGSKSCHLRRVL